MPKIGLTLQHKSPKIGLTLVNKLKTTLTQKYDFCFSHYFIECKPELKNLKTPLPDFEKSKHLHGHSVKIEVSVNCKDSFFSRDFMNDEVGKVLNIYNNKMLNDYLEKVSCESLAKFLWDKLKDGDLGEFLEGVVIQETRRNRVFVFGGVKNA